MSDSTAILSFPQAPQDRMRLAMRRLQDALAEQAVAIQAFREEIARLRQAATGLEGSLSGYNAALNGVKVELVHAKAAARTLEQTAAQMQAQG